MQNYKGDFIAPIMNIGHERTQCKHPGGFGAICKPVAFW
jgi:hypothetical protein